MAERIWWIDAARGAAVVMMVLFHFLWDLNYFGFARFELYSGPIGLFQKATAGLFLLLVGACIVLSAQKHKEKFLAHSAKRGARVFFFAMSLTVFTFLFFPGQAIFFGVLHLIAFATFVAAPFAKNKKASLALAGFFILLPLALELKKIGIWWLSWAGLSMPPATLDYFPVFPWLGVVFAGIFFGNILFSQKQRKPSENEMPKNLGIHAVSFAGKNSLAIYFLHQPVLFLLFYLFFAAT